MPMKITNDCTNCGVCEILCPYNAIYPGGTNWRKIHNRYFSFCDEEIIHEDFRSQYHYYVVPDKCTECVGKYPSPICSTGCSNNAILKDILHQESEEQLFAKRDYLETMAGLR